MERSLDVQPDRLLVPPDASGNARWALILVGGEGTRLRPLTRRISGEGRPKQFCRIVGGESLFEQTRERARLLIEPARTLLVLTRAHQAFYTSLLTDTDPGARIVQPLGRGTAPAIVYGLLRIEAVSPAATVVILACPATDFSTAVLARTPARLAVLAVAGLGWTDLGQPSRVLAVLRALGLQPAWAVERPAESA